MSTDRNTARARSLRNLRPWRPGQSGNPAGRPVNPDCLTACLRELAAVPVRSGAAETHAQRLAAVLWRKACAGDLRAAALVLDRLEGRPGQAVTVAAAGPLSVSELAASMSMAGFAAAMHTGSLTEAVARAKERDRQREAERPS